MTIERRYRAFSRYALLSILVALMFVTNTPNSYAEEFPISIPFGAYNPQLDTPTDEWYSPSVMYVNVGDTVTWTNDDQEGHTVTSGEGPGRFEWMGNDDFGTPDGIFDSERFMPGESWSYTFEDIGIFKYYCVIHPWMEGVVVVESKIPDYPHDYLGNKVEFPVDATTVGGSVIIGLTWEPPVLKTNEKTQFVYHFHDVGSEERLLNQKYDFTLIQNGKEIFSDSGITGAGGDYRNFIFKEPGDVIIRFTNIQSAGTSAVNAKSTGEVIDSSVNRAEFSTPVYENPEGKKSNEIIVQPAKRLTFQYELAVALVIVPMIIFIGALIWMKKQGKQPRFPSSKSTPV